MGKIDNITKLNIIAKMKSGCTQRQLSRELNISQPAIRYIWKKYMITGDIMPLPKSGRKPIYSPRDRRIICIQSKKILS